MYHNYRPKLTNQPPKKEISYTIQLFDWNQTSKVYYLLSFYSDLALSITKNGPVAVQAAKKAIRDGELLDIKEALAVEKKYYKKTIGTEDRQEGIQAFLEKRSPIYTGK